MFKELILQSSDRYRHNPLDDQFNPWAIRIVGGIVVFVLILIIAYVYDKNKLRQANIKFQFYEELDTDSKMLHDEIDEIHRTYETATYSFMQNLKHSRSSGPESRDVWCKEYIAKYRETQKERNSKVQDLKTKHGTSKINRVLQNFEWTNYTIDLNTFKISKDKVKIQ